jgi:hypothetical protein
MMTDYDKEAAFLEDIRRRAGGGCTSEEAEAMVRAVAVRRASWPEVPFDGTQSDDLKEAARLAELIRQSYHLEQTYIPSQIRS